MIVEELFWQSNEICVRPHMSGAEHLRTALRCPQVCALTQHHAP
jgi:hypothetical protein